MGKVVRGRSDPRNRAIRKDSYGNAKFTIQKGTRQEDSFVVLHSRDKMVEPQSSVHAGRAVILGPEEKIDAGEYTLADLMEKIEAIPSNKRLLRQIGVRESVQRVRAIPQPAQLHKGSL